MTDETVSRIFKKKVEPLSGSHELNKKYQRRESTKSSADGSHGSTITVEDIDQLSVSEGCETVISESERVEQINAVQHISDVLDRLDTKTIDSSVYCIKLAAICDRWFLRFHTVLTIVITAIFIYQFC